MFRILIPAALALVLAACASGARMDGAERLALYRAHAGEPVGSIRHPGRFTGWSAVGTDALVLRTRPNEAFLLELSTPCPDLPVALAIQVSSRTGMISARFDSVTPLGPATASIRVPCHIGSIRPLDVAALREAEAALREATPVERADQAPTAD